MSETRSARKILLKLDTPPGASLALRMPHFPRRAECMLLLFSGDWMPALKTGWY